LVVGKRQPSRAHRPRQRSNSPFTTIRRRTPNHLVLLPASFPAAPCYARTGRGQSPPRPNSILDIRKAPLNIGFQSQPNCVTRFSIPRVTAHKSIAYGGQIYTSTARQMRHLLPSSKPNSCVTRFASPPTTPADSVPCGPQQNAAAFPIQRHRHFPTAD
jgi:hypothetical protein